jgi:hypothetical protein
MNDDETKERAARWQVLVCEDRGAAGLWPVGRLGDDQEVTPGVAAGPMLVLSGQKTMGLAVGPLLRAVARVMMVEPRLVAGLKKLLTAYEGRVKP